MLLASFPVSPQFLISLSDTICFSWSSRNSIALRQPSHGPSVLPSRIPSLLPSPMPSSSPSSSPSNDPSSLPSLQPSQRPSTCDDGTGIGTCTELISRILNATDPNNRAKIELCNDIVCTEDLDMTSKYFRLSCRYPPCQIDLNSNGFVTQDNGGAGSDFYAIFEDLTITGGDAVSCRVVLQYVEMTFCWIPQDIALILSYSLLFPPIFNVGKPTSYPPGFRVKEARRSYICSWY